MRNFIVNVNGNSYEVQVEEVGEVSAPMQAPIAPTPAPKASAPAPAPKASAAAVSGTKIESPMPGTILSVNVTNGQAVKEGDTLMVLEAMKMENEILAPCDGKVASVNVAKGQAVETGELLAVIG